MFRRKPNIRVIVNRAGNLVARMNGRYLLADMKISTRSKRGRENAREIAQAILAEVGANEKAFSLISDIVTNENNAQQPADDDGPALKSVAHPNDPAMVRD